MGVTEALHRAFDQYFLHEKQVRKCWVTLEDSRGDVERAEYVSIHINAGCSCGVKKADDMTPSRSNNQPVYQIL